MSLEQQMIMGAYKQSILPVKKVRYFNQGDGPHKQLRSRMSILSHQPLIQLDDKRRHSLTKSFNSHKIRFQGIEEIPIEGFSDLMNTYQNQKPQYKKNFIAVFDSLFKEKIKSQEKKDQQQLKETKFYKTFIQEKMEDIEKTLVKNHQSYLDEQRFRDVTELVNKAHTFDERKAQLDVFQGRYILKINKKLPYNRKIEKFAQQPVAYYLHKKNDFIKRINQADRNLDRKDENKFQSTMKKILQTSNIAMAIQQDQDNEEAEKLKLQAQNEEKSEEMLIKQKTRHSTNFKANIRYFQESKQSKDIKEEILKAIQDQKEMKNNAMTLQQMLKLKFDDLDRKRHERKSFNQSYTPDSNKIYPKDQLISLAMKKLQRDQMQNSLEIQRVDEKREVYKTEIQQNKMKYKSANFTSLDSPNQSKPRSPDLRVSQNQKYLNKTINNDISFIIEGKTQQSPDDDEYIEAYHNRAKTNFGLSRNSLTGTKSRKINRHNRTTFYNNNNSQLQDFSNCSMQQKIENRCIDSQIFHEKLLLNKAVTKFNDIIKKQSPRGAMSQMEQMSQTTYTMKDLSQFNQTQTLQFVDLKDMKKKKDLETIMKSCYQQNHHTQFDITQLKNQIEKYRVKDQQFSLVSGTLKELEGVDASVLQQIYDYKVGEKEDDEKEAKKVTRDYKMNYLDPNKYNVALRNEQSWKNAFKRKRFILKSYK